MTSLASLMRTRGRSAGPDRARSGNAIGEPALRLGDGRVRAIRGQSLTELAILLPVLLLVTMGVLDLGRAFYTYEAIANAAREGARFCALNPGGDAQARVTLELTGTPIEATASPSTCSVKGPGGIAEGERVDVTVTTSFLPVTLFFETIPLSATASMVMW